MRPRVPPASGRDRHAARSEDRGRALGIVVASVAIADGLAASADTPVLELAYTATNVLSVSAPNGDTFTAASATRVVPPGTYVVTIEDDAYDGTDPAHMFHLTGPGINLMTDLQGGDDKSEIYTETLAANSTYTFKDDYEANLPAIVFTTTGTPAPPSSTPAPAVPTQTTTARRSRNRPRPRTPISSARPGRPRCSAGRSRASSAPTEPSR